MRILVVEDDQLLARQLLKLLKKNYIVDQVNTKSAAEYLMDVNSYDLAIIDLSLPDGTGMELCQNWRDDSHTIPCLIISAKYEMKDKLNCLDIGADDFLSKPFHPEELLCRVRALLRRIPRYQAHKYAVGKCHFDSSNKQLSYQDKFIQLNCKEGQLLEILLRHQGSIVTRSMIIESVWENTDDMGTNTIEVHISRLRRRIEQQFSMQCIKTVRNVGYLIPHEIAFIKSGGELKKYKSTNSQSY